MDFLETLQETNIAVKAMKVKKTDVTLENPVDRHYRTIKTEILPVDHYSPTYKLVEDYLTTTVGPTHTNYHLELQDVFQLKKDTKFKDVGNRMLLWHGSRLSNFVGILTKGLRIVPKEAPATGYMFGKVCCTDKGTLFTG